MIGTPARPLLTQIKPAPIQGPTTGNPPFPAEYRNRVCFGSKSRAARRVIFVAGGRIRLCLRENRRMQDPLPALAHRVPNMMKHACVAARIGDDAKRGAANMSILASRATKCPAQGGAGSKRCVLGCDPGAGQWSAGCAVLTRAFTVASRKRVPAPRSGALPILAATPARASEYPMTTQGLARVLAHGFVASPLLSRSKRRALLRALSQNRDSASRVSSC